MALKVVIAGASGKMGRCLIEAVTAEGMVLHAALDAPGSVAIGQRLGQLGIDAGAEAAHVVVTDDVAQALRGADDGRRRTRRRVSQGRRVWEPAHGVRHRGRPPDAA